MNFIYDIVLNFNKEYFNFFEWDKGDNIVNIKKIPLIRVKDDIFLMMKYDDIVVDSSFIDYIKDKTIIYSKKKVETDALISNGKEVIGVMFNYDGVLLKRSSLLLDEEDEVLEEINFDDVFDVNIVKVKKGKYINISRMEKEKKDFLIKYINSEQNIVNLKYLYYDYFEEDEKDIRVIKDTLIKEIRNNWNKRFESFYETVKMFSKIKN